MTIKVYNANTYCLKSSCLPPMVHALEDAKTGLSLKILPALVLCDSVTCRNKNICKRIISTGEKKLRGLVLTEVENLRIFQSSG